MPANLIWVFAAWVATHLVSFSLLGFLVAGVLLSGTVETPEGAAGPAAQVQAGSSASPDPARDERVAPTAENGSALVPHKVPRLIGGTLPMHQEARVAPEPRGYTPTAGGDAFRPPGEVAAAEPVRMTRDESVQRARRAFWNGDFETAEAAYMALISEYPADADAFGELGNLYQSMGEPARALDAYYEAGIRLKSTGDIEKLQQIIDLFVQEGDARAARLSP